MTDLSNSRQILPSTVSSAAAAGPATSSRARVSIACEACKKKKCKCNGGPPCESCHHAKIRCVFDETQDKRRKVHAKRTIEDLTSTNEHLTFEVKVFRTLQKAIQNDTCKDAFEQIRRHASLMDIALALRDSIPEVEDGEAELADTDLSLHESDFADALPGQAFHQSRGVAPADDAMNPLLRNESMNSDFMELDHPTNNTLNGSDMREMQHERNLYKRIVTELQNCTGSEAKEALRQLRAPRERNTLHDSQLRIRQDDQTAFGISRTLPEISTSIRTPRTSWFQREGSGNRPLWSATSPHAAQKSTTNASAPGSQARVSPPIQSGFSTGSTGMGLSQYITSAERLRRESGTYADKACMRSK